VIDIEALLEAARTEAATWDENGLPDSVITMAAQAGLLGMDRPKQYGGGGVGAHECGAVAAQLGAVCTSLRSLFTVQGLVAAAVDRWGTAEQRATWLPSLVHGDMIAGLAVTESGAGSDLSSVSTTFQPAGANRRVSGRKLWVTFGAVADVLLVLGRSQARAIAALVETDRPGVVVDPVSGQLGMRGTRIAHVSFENVAVPELQLIAPPGFGLTHVVGTALDHGRYTIAWGCVGMAQACLADARSHAARRTQGGVTLGSHQTVRALLGRSWVDVESARALCTRAADQRATHEPEAVLATVVAKYAAANAATAVSERAVQVLGAAGCTADSRVGRFFRDAKVMQIIEGSREVAELNIGDFVLNGVDDDAESMLPGAAS
jgi:methoxymalonate biosynthesis protein